MPEDQLPLSDFPPDHGGSYGFFGYQGYMVDCAIMSDRVDWLNDAIARRYMDKTTKTIGNMTMLELARFRKAVRCEARLLELGWT